MILKGSQRGGGQQLAAHLLRTDENEHVEVHQIRGFVAEDVHGAFAEAHAMSKGTKARQFLFSLSLNPPRNEKVPVKAFEAAIDRVEERLGLIGQPRMVFFHEKDGRRHAHSVWLRINTQEMKAIPLPYFGLKLRDVARELYLEHGWRMPPGFLNPEQRDPLNMGVNEWQQAQRARLDPQALKRMFRECWMSADSGKAFAQALKAQGFTLARGEGRFVALDCTGKPYSIAKYTGQRAKQVRQRLGDLQSEEWPSISDAMKEINERVSAAQKAQIQQAERADKLRSASLRFQYTQVLQRQRDEREKLRQAQEQRWDAETAARAARLSRGWRGVWDRVTGKHQRVTNQNEREALLALHRDRDEKDSLIFRHIEEREGLQKRIREERKTHALELQQMHQDVAGVGDPRQRRVPDLRGDFDKAVGPGSSSRRPKREQDFEPGL